MKNALILLLALLLLAAVPAMGEGLSGGWSVTADAAVTEEAAAALESAVSGLVGCSYEPVALLGTQVVAGTNYSLLCRLTPVVPDPVPGYAVVTVWQPLSGEAEILSVEDITLGVPAAD